MAAGAGKKIKKQLIRLESSAGTGTFYIRMLTKNIKDDPTKSLSCMKYDRKIRKHVLFNAKKHKK